MGRLGVSLAWSALPPSSRTRVAVLGLVALSAHLVVVAVEGVSVYRHVQATTASDLTAEQWRAAWMLAAPVVVAANRYVEAENDGTPGLIEDAHFQLLRALTDYKAAAGGSE